MGPDAEMSGTRRPPRLLYVSDNFPPFVSGVARVGEMICEGLPPEQVTVLGPRWEGDADFDRRAAYRVVRVRCRSTRWNRPGLRRKYDTAMGMARLGWALARLLRRERFDAVYFSSVWPLGIWAWLPLRFGLPYLVHAHGQEIVRPMPGIAGKLRGWVLRKAARIIANSAWTRDKVLRHDVAERQVAIVHPDIDPARFDAPVDVAAFREQEGLAGKHVLLVVAHVQPNKGFDRIIRVLPEVLAVYPDTAYVVVGEGPYIPELERLADSLGVRGNVHFVGNRNVAEFFHACDIYVMTTLYDLDRLHLESFGIVFLEAGACGKPVIGSNIGGIPESVADGESGILVEPDDLAAIRDAILRLLGDPALREELGRNGRERVRTQFAFPASSRAVAVILDEVTRRED